MLVVRPVRALNHLADNPLSCAFDSQINLSALGRGALADGVREQLEIVTEAEKPRPGIVGKAKIARLAPRRQVGNAGRCFLERLRQFLQRLRRARPPDLCSAQPNEQFEQLLAVAPGSQQGVKCGRRR